MAVEEELISKKEVLEKTGISYGQFYRWKRKGIIPESWFIRKSTFTGQETFLPKEKILERIEKIKALKDQYSLDEIAEVLSPEAAKLGFSEEEIKKMDWLSKDVLDYYKQLRRQKGQYSFKELFYMAIIEQLRRRDLAAEELDLAVATLLEHDIEIEEGVEKFLAIVRKEFSNVLTQARPKIAICCIFNECLFDPKTEVAIKLELSKILEEIKINLRGVI